MCRGLCPRPALTLVELALAFMLHGEGLKGTETSILSAEHLAAIMLQTGRNKDYIRLESMLAYEKFDKSIFMEIINRHKLQETWTAYVARFLKEEE